MGNCHYLPTNARTASDAEPKRARAGEISGEAVAEGDCGGGGAGGNIELVEDRRNVPHDGPVTDEEFFGDLAIRFPFDQQRQHFPLPFRDAELISGRGRFDGRRAHGIFGQWNGDVRDQIANLHQPPVQEFGIEAIFAQRLARGAPGLLRAFFLGRD